MSYGLRTFSEDGVVELDTDSFTYQVLHSQTYTLTGNGAVVSVPISGFNPATCTAVILPTTARKNEFNESAMPYMRVAVGNVTVRSKHPNQPGTEDSGSHIQFRLLVMRFKN
ncbi:MULTISPECIES: hypothetical protein [Pseudomonas]|jgi:hypothetical protein|uniref:hypothetical protein n=1 Tax=Pseudomonas TaxID=286 RepID=UPI0011CE5FB2|nr:MULTISPECIES: hypothetical protein [Pseudomonas]MBG8559130.1 hypothetical protein [Pseudomonas qingdaonensis]WEJ19274.1 hypothetical protein N0B28_13265 [Pseudomonas sp. SD17-1]